MNVMPFGAKVAVAAIVIAGGAFAINSFKYDTQAKDSAGRPAADSGPTHIIAQKAPVSRSLSAPRIVGEADDISSSTNPLRAESQPEIEKRVATLKDDLVSTNAKLVIEDGETSGRIYFDILVVNESGIPLSGATVDMTGKRTRVQSSGWYGWGKPEVKELTNKDGIARVSAPQFTFEKLDTGAVTFKVSHPDYASANLDMPFNNMTKVVLRSGWKLQVIASDENSSTPLKSGITMEFNSWFPPDYNQLKSGIVDVRKISDKELKFYVSHKSESGNVALSHMQTIEFPRKTNEPVPVTVYTAYAINGKLSDNVPRPVKNGKVVAVGASGEKSHGSYSRKEVDINADGSFHIIDMPQGEIMIWALADGWCSVLPNKEARQGMPQKFQLTKKGQEYTLPMNATATAIFRVVDSNGSPAVGAVVATWPNMCMENSCGMWIRQSEFSTTTTAEGLAVIPDLPPLTKAGFTVYGPYELPPKQSSFFDTSVSRDVNFDLTSGQTLEETLVVYPRGTTAITQHGDTMTTRAGEQ